jgi:hypothetical protein
MKNFYGRRLLPSLLPGGGVAISSAGRLVFDAQGRLIEHNGPDTERELAERWRHLPERVAVQLRSSENDPLQACESPKEET